MRLDNWRLWLSENRAVFASGIPALGYFIYIARFAVDVPHRDDLVMIAPVSTALSGGPRLHDAIIGGTSFDHSGLWSQYSNNRLFMQKVVFVVSGYIDHLNLRHVMLFSACLFTISFVLLMVLYRRYADRPTPWYVALALGAVWFSFGGFFNALMAFQVGWYLAVFFFAVVTYCLISRPPASRAWFAIAVGAATLGSLSTVQGFAIWVAGAVCLLWCNPLERSVFGELATWVGAAALTAATYSAGFDFSLAKTVCIGEGGNPDWCGFGYGLLHPIDLGKFLAVLATNFIQSDSAQYVGIRELLGTLIWIAVGFVIFKSFRNRGIQKNPLPVVIIVFATLFDLMLAMGRLGLGIDEGALRHYYVMPNIILIFGLLVYVFANSPDLATIRSCKEPRRLATAGLLLALVVALVVVTAWETAFGIEQGRRIRDSRMTMARVFANIDQIPAGSRDCYMAAVVGNDFPNFGAYGHLHLAWSYDLSLFNDVDGYKKLGLPSLTLCNKSDGLAQPG